MAPDALEATRPAPERPTPSRDGSFLEAMAFGLSFGEIEVAGGNVKRLCLDAFAHGFHGSVEFWVEVDGEDSKLHELMLDPARLDLELRIAKTRYLGEKPPPLTVKGVVTGRSFVEVAAGGVANLPILFRKYRLEFSDVLAFYWSQHRPSIVYANTSLQKVLEEHAPEGAVLNVTHDAFKAKRPIVCLALGADEASYYDFAAWVADALGCHFYYDYAKGQYRFASEKPAAGAVGEVVPLPCREISVRVYEPPRHSVNLRNSHSALTATTAITNARAASGVYRDVLLHTPLSASVQGRQKLETARLAAGRAELTLSYSEFPELHPLPGALAQLSQEEFSSHLHYYDETLRTLAFHCEAVATDESPEVDLDVESTAYSLSVTYTFESVDDPRPRLPAFRRPRYPLWVEGKVVSDLGQTGDRSYLVYEDEKTSLDYYHVALPVWNATIEVPFRPQYQPGHLYFPAYKDARVMLSVGFDWANIDYFLDFGERVRVPMPSQGNHILFGKNETSETSMRHWYVDAKPVLDIRRAHNGDLGVVTVSDGSIVLETFDDESAAGGLTETVSLEPELAAGKAKASAQADMAAADLQSAAGALSGTLNTQLGSASAALKADAKALESQVRAEVEQTQASLNAASADTEVSAAQARQLVADAQRDAEVAFSSALDPLTQLRATLQALSADVSATGARLEQAGQTLLAELTAEPAKVQASVAPLQLRLREAESRARADIQVLSREATLKSTTLPPGSPARAALTARVGALDSTLQAAFTPANSLLGRASTASASLATQTTATKTSVAQILAASQTARTGFLQRLASADGGLGQVTRTLGALRKTTLGTLNEVQTEFLGRLDAVRQPLTQTADKVSSAVGTVSSEVSNVTSTVSSGLTSVELQVEQLFDTAQGLIDKLDSALTTGLATLDKIPVAALPKPMVAATRSTLTQAINQLGTALGSAAKAVGAQLEALGAPLKTQIDTVQAALAQQVEAARSAFSAQLNQLRTEVTRVAAEVNRSIGEVLSGLQQQMASQTAALGTQIAESSAPAISTANAAASEVRAALDKLARDVDASLGGARSSAKQQSDTAAASVSQWGRELDDELVRAVARLSAELTAIRAMLVG